jgi:hypothetical protein
MQHRVLKFVVHWIMKNWASSCLVVMKLANVCILSRMYPCTNRPKKYPLVKLNGQVGNG